MTESGLVVLCAFISTFRAERLSVRELLEPGEFIAILVGTPSTSASAVQKDCTVGRSRATSRTLPASISNLLPWRSEAAAHSWSTTPMICAK